MQESGNRSKLAGASEGLARQLHQTGVAALIGVDNRYGPALILPLVLAVFSFLPTPVPGVIGALAQLVLFSCMKYDASTAQMTPLPVIGRTGTA